eukprot:TRINITY_DN16741_c0_g1_i1.p1 TRINITY_DN16741_c0_g1~~TRINITY_DN16741_c0_g1_i1.p1  ORF type:complete len:485 (+),score=61.88 TRINITY_DN16741_c0_g1_i1:58-1512(+)
MASAVSASRQLRASLAALLGPRCVWRSRFRDLRAYTSVGAGALRMTQSRLAPRDAYSVMGLSRTASAEEVKERFRVLAKKYHPDLNTGDRSAAMKMAELTNAYDTLNDPRKRAALDQATAGAESSAGSASGPRSWGGPFSDFARNAEEADPSQMFSEFQDVFGRGGPHRPPGSKAMASRGEDLAAEIEVPFLDAMRGCEKVVSVMARQSCMDCRGTGAKPGTSWSTCRVCRGTGVQRVERGILSMGIPCNRCQGHGEILDHPCRVCKGDGARLQPRDVRVAVPAGVRNLMELRVPGAGHSGFRGGKSGHLFATVKVLPHEHFRHIDDDVHLDIALTLGQALLGGEVAVPTLAGGTETMLVQAPTQPGTTKVLRGRGPPRIGGEGRGHLVLRFVLQLPNTLDSRQVELIQEFDEITARAEQAAGSTSTGTDASGGRRHKSAGAASGTSSDYEDRASSRRRSASGRGRERPFPDTSHSRTARARAM